MNATPWSVRVEAHREVAQGERLKVAVRAGSERLDRIALVVDFRRLRQLMDDLLEALPHEVVAADDPLERAHAVSQWLLARLLEATAGEDYRILDVEVSAADGIAVIATTEV